MGLMRQTYKEIGLYCQFDKECFRKIKLLSIILNRNGANLKQ